MKFSIRDLMWLMALASLVLGWWADHRQLDENRWTWKVRAENAEAYLKAREKELEAVKAAALPISQTPAPNPPNP